jgi:hypothetical protein
VLLAALVRGGGGIDSMRRPVDGAGEGEEVRAVAVAAVEVLPDSERASFASGSSTRSMPWTVP